jgi:hypothetical protein
MATGYCQIIAVADSNYKKKKGWLCEVTDPKGIVSLDYDYIVVAIEDLTIAKQAADYLKRLGILEPKILVMKAYYYEQIQNNYTYTVTNNQYKPWESDTNFIKLLEYTKGKTLVDSLRLFELYGLLKQCAKLEGNILEVGVYKGGSGALISILAKEYGKQVYLADTFEGIVKATDIDLHKDGDFSDTSKEDVKNYLDGILGWGGYIRSSARRFP